MKRITIYVTSFMLTVPFIWDAFALMVKVGVEHLTIRSHTIIRGEVTNVWADFADRNTKEIVTYISVKVGEVGKGVSSSVVTLVIPGGGVGNLGLWVEDTPYFVVGEQVVLFVKNDYKDRLTVTEWRQGKFPIFNEKIFLDGNEILVSDFINAIKGFIANGEQGRIDFKFIEPNGNANRNVTQGMLVAPVISSVSPNLGPAIRPYAINPNDPFNPGDRGTIINIYGTGFGAIQGTGSVVFNGASADAIILWSDTQITCKVPGNQYNGTTFYNASSGNLYVLKSDFSQSNIVQFTVPFATSSKRFPTPPITYYINQNGTPDCASEFTAAQTAFQVWENVTFSNLAYTYGGTTTRVPSTTDDFNDCGWIESNWPFESSAIAVNRIQFDGTPSSNQIYNFDLLFNGVNFTWSCSGEAGKMDVQNVATHEAGHSLNLRDLYGSVDSEKTMYGNGVTGETKKQTLETDDIAGTRYVYPEPYSLTLQNSFEFDGTTGGQISVKNVSQGTNTITHNTPLTRTVSYGTTFEFVALSQQTINSRNYVFGKWADAVTSMNRQVTIGGSGTYTANYLWHLHSGSAFATVLNNQRKIVYEGTTYHTVFETSGEIYYTYSNDNGSTWSNETIVSDGNGGNKYSSIDIINGIVVVVWQQEFPSTGKICLRRKTAGGWQAQQEVVSFFAGAGFTATPVVIASGTFDYHLIWHDYSLNNLLIRTYNESNGWVTNATAIPSTNSNSLYPALTRDTYDFAHLAWAESGTIYYTKIQFNGSSYTFSPSKENVSSGTGYTGHGYPSITTDNNRRPSVAWQSTNDPGPIIQRRRELSGSWSTAQVFSGSDYYNTPSITGYPNVTNNNNLAIVWRRDPTTIRLAKYVNSVWTQYLESATGYDPNLSANFTGSAAAKIVLRSGSASPYTITTTSQNLPKSMATRIAHYRRGVMQLGKVELAFDVGDFFLNASGSKIPVELFAYNDTLVVGHTGAWNDMFRTDPITWPVNNGLELQNGFSIINPNLIGGVLPPGTAVVFTLEAVNAATNTPRANLYQQVVNSANILPFTGKRQIATPAGLAGQSIYLRVAVQTQGAIVAKPSFVEIYHETSDSSGLGKPELTDGAGLPKVFTLYSNYPNPFSTNGTFGKPETVIRFDLPETREIELTIFNMVGEKIKTLLAERRTVGSYVEIWDGRNSRGEPVTSGVYFLKMRAGDFTTTQKMMLLR